MGRITRRLEFDAAHRVMRHESKCRNLHGHRYVVEVTIEGDLDPLGRVVDFGVVKSVLGEWIDEWLDHGVVCNSRDTDLVALCQANEWKVVTIADENPTAEVLADFLVGIARNLLELPDSGLKVVGVRVWETPNCYADSTPETLGRSAKIVASDFKITRGRA